MQQLLIDLAPLLVELNTVRQRHITVAKACWTEQEHALFLEGTILFGRNQFKRIARHVGGMSGTQVCSHSQKYFQGLEAAFNTAFKRFPIALVENVPEVEALLRAAIAGQIKEQCFLPRIEQVTVLFRFLNGMQKVLSLTQDGVLSTEFAKWLVCRRADLLSILQEQLG